MICITHLKKLLMLNFIGKSGQFYVKNPFDNGKYSYAIYESQERFQTPFNRGYVTHTSNETAFADHLKDIGGFVFTVQITGQQALKVEVSLDGKTTDGTEFKEQLANLINTHGRQNVKYAYERL